MSALAIKFEIVQQHDPYSITSSSSLHAAAAVILLGEGNFALRTRPSSRRGQPVVVCPVFSLSGHHGLDDWWVDQQRIRGNIEGVDFFEWCDREKRGIADALETVRLEAPARTSIEDLAFQARQLAREFHEQLAREATRDR